MHLIPTIHLDPPPPEPDTQASEASAGSAEGRNALDLAQHCIAQGFTTLLVSGIGLGAEHTAHRDPLHEIIRDARPTTRVYVSGATRDAEAIDALFRADVAAVVVGQLGREAPLWLHEQAELYPARLIPSIELEERHLTSTGWATAARHSLDDFLADHGHVPFGGLVVRAVRRRGKAWVVDLSALEDLLDASPWPVIVSAGAATLRELRELEDCGLTAALFDVTPDATAIDAHAFAEEFAR